MTGPNVFLSQLRLGERILWNASGSAELRDAAYKRSQRRNLLHAAGLAIFGVGWLVYDSMSTWQRRPDALALLFVALSPVSWAAVAALALSVTLLQICLRRGKLHRRMATWHRHYALTDQRVLSVDENGDLIDQIEGREIIAVELEEGPRPSTVLVERRIAEEDEKHLLLTDLEQPLIAKTMIEKTFLEPAP